LVSTPGKSAEDKADGQGQAGKENQAGGARGPVDRGMPQLDDLYREVVLDHYKHPRGREKLPHPNVSVEGFNPTCGDHVHVALTVEEGKISEAQVDCQGCSNQRGLGLDDGRADGGQEQRGSRSPGGVVQRP